MHIQSTFSPAPVEPPLYSGEAAEAYDAVGRHYQCYADGETGGLFDFSSRYSFADQQVWMQLDARLMAMAAQGRRDVSILDVGCGPGTWLCRIIHRAGMLGFTAITARGFDVSPAMIALARDSVGKATSELGPVEVHVSVETGDACDRLAQADRSVDLCLCLYGVLNHLPRRSLPGVAAELARVTRGELFLTVRAAGSMPTIYVDSIDRARSFRQDNIADRMEVDMLDGQHLSFHSHLFRSADLTGLFGPHLASMTLTGLDLFHSRFATDPRWNPDELAAEAVFAGQLVRLEQSYAHDPDFMDRAAHIMLTGRPAAHLDRPTGRRLS